MTTDKEHNCRNDEQSKSDIEKFGLSVIVIEATDYLPSFAYSIGLWQKFKHPEIICFGLRTQTLHTIINELADLVRNGQIFLAGKNYDNIFENSNSKFLNVDKRNLDDYFATAIDFYNSKYFQELQLL